MSELPECRHLLAGEPQGVALVGRWLEVTLTYLIIPPGALRVSA
ncbi:hypothetical protein ACFCZQ_27795 [Streptomyces virginiae]